MIAFTVGAIAKSHQIAIVKAKTVCDVITNQVKPMDQQLSSQYIQKAFINQEKLHSSTATIIF